MEGNALTAFLANVTELVTQMLVYVGDVAELIVSTPIFYIPIGLVLLSWAGGFVSRFVRGL